MTTPASSSQQCANCEKLIAAFFSTCPYCQHKVQQAQTNAEDEHELGAGQAVDTEVAPQDSRLTECRDCGHQVSKFAKACPGCGSAAFSQEVTVQKGTTACAACASQVALAAKQCPSCGTRDFLKPADGLRFWLELVYRGLMFTAGGIMLYALVRCSAAVID